MSKTQEHTSYTVEALRWANVQGEHETAQYLRGIAITGTRSLMDHVGLDADLSTITREQDYVTCSELKTYTRRALVEEVKTTQPILVGEYEAGDELGLTHEFARIEERSRGLFYTVHSRLFGDSVTTGEPVVDFSITRYVGTTRDDKPYPRVLIPQSQLSMLRNPAQLDVRKMCAWAPDAMSEHYQEQIASTARFMDAIKNLSELTDGHWLFDASNRISSVMRQS